MQVYLEEGIPHSFVAKLKVDNLPKLKVDNFFGS